MCTAITFHSDSHYFGRNLDLEYHYNETVTITPRNYPLYFRKMPEITKHYAIIGVATVSQGYPLYYDATNECGLSIAGLNFPESAQYQTYNPNMVNIAPFELIPWILSQCRNIQEAETILLNLNPLNVSFSDAYPISPLHWIIADWHNSITVEPVESGLKIYKNPMGVLTNNPPFDYHMYNLSNYLNITSQEPRNRFSTDIDLQPYSSGMGAIGLPGDLSSSSRFVRAAFTKLNSKCLPGENESISQFFHILDSVFQQEGCARVGEHYEKTIYTSCCNTDKCIYYYKTYENSQISSVSMHHEDLNGSTLISYPMIHEQKIFSQN